jgi:hypothetical protein
MVAFSGLVNDDVRKSAKEAGFEVVIESPLSVQKINEMIISKIKERGSTIQTAKNEI